MGRDNLRIQIVLGSLDYPNYAVPLFFERFGGAESTRGRPTLNNTPRVKHLTGTCPRDTTPPARAAGEERG